MTLAADLRMLARGLLGKTPPPLIARTRTRTRRAEPAAAALAPRAGQARTVVVTQVVRETADAVSVTFRDPAGASLAFTPGQFFTIELVIDGERVRRAYSASSDSRTTDTATITVKRVAGGRASTFLVERAASGSTFGVLGPSGDFAHPPDARVLVAIAGGSGITPIMAIARAVLATPDTRLAIVYGNRDRAAIIFADALAGLAAAHPDRLAIHHVLGATGLDAMTIAAQLDAIAPPADAHYLLCGPTPMMAAARVALTGRRVAAAQIREERFFAPARAAAPLTPQPVTIRLGARTLDVVVRAGETILEAGLAAGVPMKLSCAMGGCGACAVTLVSGDVVLDEPSCLTPAERGRGVILACVARPTSPCTIEVT